MTTSSQNVGDYRHSRYAKQPSGAKRSTYRRAGEAYYRSTEEKRRSGNKLVEYSTYDQRGRNDYQSAYTDPATRSASSGAEYYGQAQAGGDRFDFMPPDKKKDPRRKKRRRVILIVVAVVVVALLAVVAVYGVNFLDSAKAVRAEASTITKTLSQTMKDFSNSDFEAVSADVGQMAASAAFMKEETSGPLWDIAERIPGVGNDAKNARVLSNVFDDMCQNMLVPFSAELPNLSLGSIVREDHSIDVGAITSLIGSINQYREVISRSNDAIEDLTPGTVEQANKALETAQEYLGQADSLFKQAETILPLLPQMLGANGTPRNYLIIAQTNAELRATGGFSGSWGVLTVADGRIEMGDFMSFAAMRGIADTPVQMQPGEDLFFYPDFHEPGQYDLTPNFARFSQLSADYWLKGSGLPVDGVIAIDPIFLGKMLGVVGGVEGLDGRLIDESNAVQVLEHDIYFEYSENDDMDAYFAAVAVAAFNQVIHGIGRSTLTGLIDVIGQGASVGCIQVCMANPDEQALMASLGLTGPLVEDAVNPTLGIFINDHTGSKMDYYLDVNTTIGGSMPNADGSTTYTVTTTATNLVNTDRGDPAYSLPDYVTGGTANGSMNTEFLLFAPYGGTISNVNVDTALSTADTDTLEAQPYGFNAHRRRFWINPAQTVTLTYTVTTSPEAVTPLAIRMTPTPQKAILGEI